MDNQKVNLAKRIKNQYSEIEDCLVYREINIRKGRNYGRQENNKSEV